MLARNDEMIEDVFHEQGVSDSSPAEPPQDDTPMPERWPESAEGERILEPEQATAEAPAFNPITPASWKGTEPTKQQWLATGRIPLSDLTILAGSGGSGKTEIAISLLVSVATDLGDWLGCVVESGPALFISCEEDEQNVRDRVERIAKHRGIDPHTATHQKWGVQHGPHLSRLGSFGRSRAGLPDRLHRVALKAPPLLRSRRRGRSRGQGRRITQFG